MNQSFKILKEFPNKIGELVVIGLELEWSRIFKELVVAFEC